MFRAYVNQSPDYEENLIRGLEFIRYADIIKSDMKVCVKPNFTFPVYKEGITTSPSLLDSLLKVLKNRSAEVTVIESDGGNHSFSADDAFRGHTMDRICARNGASLVNLSRTPWRRIRARVLSKTVSVPIPDVLLNDMDMLVVVPVLKVHAMTRITLSLKNLWGLNPDTMRCLSHQNLGHKLALMASILKPGLVVIDGKHILDEHGPMYGTPIRKNLLITANNTVVADSLGARLMGVNPNGVRHIRIAEKLGLGPIDLSSIQINRNWTSLCFSSSLSRTPIDQLSSIPFGNDLAARLIFQSPFSSICRTIAGVFRRPEENIDFDYYIRRGGTEDT